MNLKFMPMLNQLYRPDEASSTCVAQTKFKFIIDEAYAFYDALTEAAINCIASCMQEIHSTLKDEHQEERVIYPIDMVLMVILLAKLCGCNTADEIAAFYKARHLQLTCVLPDLPGSEHMLSPVSVNRILRMF